MKIRYTLLLGLAVFSSMLYAQGPAGVDASLELWLSSDAGVYQDAGSTASAIGDPVQEWHDRSANGHVLNNTGTARPTLHADGLDFDGLDDRLIIAGGLLTGAEYKESEVFLVKIKDTTDGEITFVQAVNPNRFGSLFQANGNVHYHGGDLADGTVTGTWGGSTGTQYLYNYYSDNDGTNSTSSIEQAILRDGTDVTSSGGSTVVTMTGTTNEFSLGGFSSTLYLLDGKIAEFIVYTKVLTDAERALVSNYLAAKYDITLAGAITFSGTYSGGSGAANAPNTSDGTKAFLVSSGNATLTTDATVASLSIANGATLSVAPNVTLTVNGHSYISGAEALVLKADATGTGNFVDNGITYKDSGSIKTETYTAPQGPAGIDGSLELWLSADVGVYQDGGTTVSAIGDPVQEWHDRSANGHVLDNTGTARPTLHADGLDFDGLDDRLKLSGGLLGNGVSYEESEIIMVKISDSSSNEVTYNQSNHPNYFAAQFEGNGNVTNYFGDLALGLVVGHWGGTTGTQYLYDFYSDNDNTNSTSGIEKRIFQDGDNISNLGASNAITMTGASNEFSLGALQAGSDHMDGKIAEFIVYTKVLTDTERALVSNYLAAKYHIDIYGSATFSGTYSGGSGVSNAPNTSDGTKALLISSGNATLSADATVASLSIANGATLSIAPNVTLTVNGETYISGANALVLKADATGTGSFVNVGGITYKDSGSIKVETYAAPSTQGPVGIGTALELWLSTDVGVYQDAGLTASAIGDPVQEWHDRSDNGHVLSNTGTARPTLHADGLDFDGTDDRLILSGGLLEDGISYDESEVFVVKITDGINIEDVFYQAVSPHYFGARLPAADGYAHYYAGEQNTGRVLAPWTGSLGTQYLWDMYSDNDDSNSTNTIGQGIFQDGTQIATLSTSDAESMTGSTSNFFLGSHHPTLFHPHGKIAELIIYTKVLSDTERSQVTNYLATKHHIETADAVTFNGSFSGGSGVSSAPNTSDDSKAFLVSSGNATLIADATVASLSIANGATLSLAPNVTLTVNGDTYINGAEALVLQSDATGTANFIDSGTIIYRESGSIKVARYLTGGAAIYTEDYHYISSPINNLAIFNDMADLYYYDEVNLNWVHHSNFTNFTNGKGYAIRYTNTTTKNFIGEANTGDCNLSLSYTDNSGSSFDYFNLVGNPYASSISADALVDANRFLIGSSVYLWNGVDYAVYNTGINAGIAGSNGPAPDGNIAVGQAFYVYAKTSGTLNFSNSMRSSDSNIFYKEEAYPEVRLMLSGAEGRSDLLITAHKASAFGPDDYDSPHLPGNGKLNVSAILDETLYDILSTPQIDGRTFDLQVAAKQAGEIHFELLEAKHLNGMHVYLEDRTAGIVTDISAKGYSTFVEKAVDTNRFKLRISNAQEHFIAWVDNAEVKTSLPGATIEEIRLLSLDGKLLEQTNGSYLKHWNDLSHGLYLLEVNTDQGKFVQKMIK